MATPETGTDAVRHTVITMAGNTTVVNAVEVLKSDHRQVEEWLDQFDATDDVAMKRRIAGDICKALEVHMRVEEEIFYPAFLEATGNRALHHQSVVEHQGVRELVRRIRLSPGAADDYLGPRVKVLAGMVLHHVAEEEGAGGMFDAAERAGLDLEALGARVEHRKIELMDDAATDRGYDEAVGRPDDGEEIGPEFEDGESDEE